MGYSPWGRKESDTTEWFHFHFKENSKKKRCSGSGRRRVFKKGQRWKRVSPAPAWVSSLVGEGVIVANGWCGSSLDCPSQSWSSPWETRKQSREYNFPWAIAHRIQLEWLSTMRRQLQGAVTLGCERAAGGSGYTEGSEGCCGHQSRVGGDCTGMTGLRPGTWCHPRIDCE